MPQTLEKDAIILQKQKRLDNCDPFCERKHAAEIRDLKLNLLFQLNVKYLTIKSWTIEVLMWLHSSEDNLSKLQRILGMDKKIRARYPSVKCYRSFVATWWWAFMSPTLDWTSENVIGPCWLIPLMWCPGQSRLKWGTNGATAPDPNPCPPVTW